ncbi:hypothetical protein EVAR_13541_1 [Eumeta japonica]|uniref:Uncharacterized protein n=1 Tax=Eumeta variegata TaxID=151549 RepID=A0A4C1U8S5_EUMVA|nr:hypothetical protein EVAR_13541_1 [Eumeta japonica]
MGKVAPNTIIPSKWDPSALCDGPIIAGECDARRCAPRDFVTQLPRPILFSQSAWPERTPPRARSQCSLYNIISLCAFCADRHPAAPRDPPGPADRESAASPAITLHSD